MNVGRIQKLLSRYREEIKGVAILWVVFFHAELLWTGLGYEIQKIGYGGVDMLLFLMGFGLYRSLSRSCELGGYLKRRARRLLPTYLPFCIAWLIVTCMSRLHPFGVVETLIVASGNLTMTAFFADISTRINWYMSALAMVIIAAPFFYACLKEGKHWTARAVGLLAFLFFMGFSFIDNEHYMAVSRLPVFALGMMFARPREEKANGGRWALVLGASGVFGLAVLYGCFAYLPQLLNGYAMYWHPFVLIAPALCAGLAWLLSKAPKRLLAPLCGLGAASFEIFLFNAWLEVWGNTSLRFPMAWVDLLGSAHRDLQRSLAWVGYSALSVLAGVAYHYAAGAVGRAIRRKKS